MDTFAGNIEEITEDNENFRRVLFTAPHSQLVVMSLEPGEDISLEKHDVDQFIRIESGEGTAILEEEKIDIEGGWAIVIPAGTLHNIINTGNETMKLYTIYSPAEHPDDTIQVTKEEAMEEESGSADKQ